MTAIAARRLFSVEEYHRMAEAGIFTPHDRVELLEGEIVQMSPIGKSHAVCVDRLNRLLSERIARRGIVRIQNPVLLGGRSELLPDVALARPREDEYAGGHPQGADLLLVVEVADSTQEYDRLLKVPAYARAQVPEVWLIDLKARALEVYRDPFSEGFKTVLAVRPPQSVAPQAFPDILIEVEPLLRGL
ncbi:MAG TPA: Uma2 family endonuclease [Planctomycetota bacterium]|nr:Uma2 family endonuclease [Planctomycetota bacterium]